MGENLVAKVFSKRNMAVFVLLLVALQLSGGTLYTGSQTVATSGTRVQLSTSNRQCNWFIVQAKPENTEPVYVGNSSVTTSNTPGIPKGWSIMYPPIDKENRYNLANFYLDAGTNGDGVTYECWSN